MDVNLANRISSHSSGVGHVDLDLSRLACLQTCFSQAQIAKHLLKAVYVSPYPNGYSGLLEVSQYREVKVGRSSGSCVRLWL